MLFAQPNIYAKDGEDFIEYMSEPRHYQYLDPTYT